MEYLKNKLFNNMKYKFLLIVLLAICFIFALESTVVIKNINLGNVELSRLDKNRYISKTIKKSDYGKIIDSLKQIKGINILNFESNSEKSKITAVVEAEGNESTIESILKKFEDIDGFYSIDSIKINECKNKKVTFVAVIYVSFV